MSVERKDAVKDQTATVGLISFVVAGSAPAGSRTITSAHTDGATVRYRAQQADNSEWEVGEGIWTASTNTLTRVTIYASSNAGAKVNFSAGTKTLWTGPVAKDTEAVSVGPTAPGSVFDGLGFYDTDDFRKSISYGGVWVEEARGTANVVPDFNSGTSDRNNKTFSVNFGSSVR